MIRKPGGGSQLGSSEAEKDPGELIRNESLVGGLISQPRLGGGGGKTLAEPKPSKSYFLEKLKKKRGPGREDIWESSSGKSH